jgi:hypothetical protein
MNQVASISGIGTQYEISTHNGADYWVTVSSGPRLLGLAHGVTFRKAMEIVTDAVEKEMADL